MRRTSRTRLPASIKWRTCQTKIASWRSPTSRRPPNTTTFKSMRRIGASSARSRTRAIRRTLTDDAGEGAMQAKLLQAQEEKTFALIFETGDEVAAGLLEFARENRLAG